MRTAMKSPTAVFTTCCWGLALILLTACEPGGPMPTTSASLNTPGVELVVFHASWCGPCRAQKPIVDDVLRDFPKVNLRRVDVDVEGELAREMKVSSIPCLLVVVDGTVQQRFVGMQSKEKLASALAAATPK